MSSKPRLSFETKILFILFSFVITAFLALFVYEIFSARVHRSESSLQVITQTEYTRFSARQKAHIYRVEVNPDGHMTDATGRVSRTELAKKITPKDQLLIHAHRDCPAETIAAIIDAAHADGIASILLLSD